MKMSEDFEKQTGATLRGQTGEIPPTIKLFAIGLDKVFAEIKQETAENHKEVMAAIAINKQHLDRQCKVCKDESDKKFNSLRIWIFLSDNPKMFRLIAGLVIVIMILAGVGSKDVFTTLTKML